MNKSKNRPIVILIVLVAIITACTNRNTAETDSSLHYNEESSGNKQELIIAVAASLQNLMTEVQKGFETDYPGVKITFTYASSGSLMNQIKQGAPIDIYISAAERQMDELEQEGFLLESSRIELFENQLVLIISENSKYDISSFEDALFAPYIAIGDPSSVPVGQYAVEVFEALGIWEDIKKRAVYGKDTREVLTWVETENAEAGVVYATDIRNITKVKIAATAPKGSYRRIIYPASIIKDSEASELAKSFMDYLISDEMRELYTEFGFINMN